jgi:hypothetical protein
MRFRRATDPGRPGQVLLLDDEPLALVVWTHDYSERARTGWFLVPLTNDGEPDDGAAVRLAVSADVEQLVADRELGRREWLARAEAAELLTAGAALGAAEDALAAMLDD